MGRLWAIRAIFGTRSRLDRQELGSLDYADRKESPGERLSVKDQIDQRPFDYPYNFVDRPIMATVRRFGQCVARSALGRSHVLVIGQVEASPNSISRHRHYLAHDIRMARQEFSAAV